MTDDSEVAVLTELPQWSPAWLRWIQSGISAQDIFSLACYSKVLGFSREFVTEAQRPNWVSTPAAVFLQKTTTVKVSPQQDLPQRGKLLPPRVLVGFNQRFTSALNPICAQHLGGVRVSLDGYDRSDGVFVEIKSPRKPWSDGVPLHVRYEVHYQRAVAELCGLVIRRQGVIAAFEGSHGKYQHGDVSFDTYPVQYDPELGAALIELARLFWAQHVVVRKAPALQSTDTRYRHDAEWVAAARHYREILAQHKRAEADLEKAREQLLSLVQEAPEAIQGGGVRVCTVPRSGSIDYKAAVSALAPRANLERFRGRSSSVKMVTLVD